MASKNGKTPQTINLDFERFWAELHADEIEAEIAPAIAPTITVAEQTYTLPATVPSILMLATLRGGDRTPQDFLAAARQMFGQDELERWAMYGMSVTAICTVVIAAERLIGGESPEEILDDIRERRAEKNGGTPTP
jgi:hypothetical protein